MANAGPAANAIRLAHRAWLTSPSLRRALDRTPVFDEQALIGIDDLASVFALTGATWLCACVVVFAETFLISPA